MSWIISTALMGAYESWHSLPGVGVGSLPATSLGGNQSAPSRSTPRPQVFLSPDKMTKASRPSRYGMTSAPLTPDLGGALLRWYREDFLVRTSASRVRVTDWMASDQGYGGRWPGSYAKLGPSGYGWRTRQLSLDGDLTTFLGSWPDSGTMLHGECLRRAASALGTNARASSLLPTLTITGNNNRPQLGTKRGYGLAALIHDGLLPTLTVQDSANNGGPSQALRRTPPLNSIMGGPLNPEWCEWFMGWPVGWTGLQPLGMDKFREWQLAHGITSLPTYCINSTKDNNHERT